MKKLDWDAFRKSEKYQKLSDHLKRVLTNLYLENTLPSEELLYDFIALKQNKITAEEFERKIIKRTKKPRGNHQDE
jgi:hypothetical protein